MKTNKYLVNKNEKLESVLEQIDRNKIGAVFVEDKGVVIGVATDGDIRRVLLKEKNLNFKINKFINKDFVFLYEENATKENILKLLDTRIRIIPILNKKKKLTSNWWKSLYFF